MVPQRGLLECRSIAGDMVVEAIDSPDPKGWDEEDFFWNETIAARERRQAKEEEFYSRINNWAAEVSIS